MLEAERDRAQRQLAQAQAQVAAAEGLVEKERGEAEGARKEAEQARDEARRIMEAAERKEAAAREAAQRALWEAEQRTKEGEAEAEKRAAAAREEAQQAREAEQRAQRARIEAEQKADEARAEAEKARKEAEQRAEKERKEAEQAAAKARKEAEQRAEKARKEAEQTAEKAREDAARSKKAEEEANRAKKEAEEKAAKARKDAERAREAEAKAAQARKKKAGGGALTRTARTIWHRRWVLLLVGLLIAGVAVAALGGSDDALYIAAGTGIGLVVALALGWLLGRSDERLRAVDDLEEVYELPVIARIPRSKSLSGRRNRRDREAFLRAASGQTAEAEAFRGLRTSLRYLSLDRELRSLAIVSPAAGDGRSTIARCLAVTMAAMGDSVVLVDANLRRADGKAAFASEDGLSLALAGFDLDDALVEVPVASDPISEKSRGLVELPSGPIPPNPAELLESERMGWVVQELESRFDRVIIDTPAVDGVSDALELVPQVSGVLLVTAVGHTRRGPAVELRKRLDLQDATPVGVIANFADARSAEPPKFERS